MPRPETVTARTTRAQWLAARRAWLGMIVLAVTLGVVDGRRPPDRQVGVRWALAGINVYQRTLSDRLPTLGVSCRFVPTCSRYAHAAIGALGLWTGARVALGRLARCGPWTPRGTVDPPPHREPPEHAAASAERL